MNIGIMAERNKRQREMHENVGIALLNAAMAGRA